MSKVPVAHALDSLPVAPGNGSTVLVQGNAGPALALWAAGLARHADPAFAWADVAPAPPGRDKIVRLLMAKSSEGTWINGVVEDDLRPRRVAPAAVAALLGGNTVGGRLPSRLETYLELPTLLQLLAARSTRPDGTSTIVVLGIEALTEARLRETLGATRVHGILRKEGIVCIASYSGASPEYLAELFDQVFEVTAPSAQEWTQSTVRTIRGAALPRGLWTAKALPTQWIALDLPAELLAIWSLPGFSPVRPR